MKFLKSYKVFESVDEIKSIIEDILRDNVLDREIPLKIHVRNYTNLAGDKYYEVIKVQIGDELADFDEFIINVDELKEDIHTITSYLEDEGYVYNTFSYGYSGEVKGDMGDVMKTLGLETTYLSLFYKKEIRDPYLESIEIKNYEITKIVENYIKECKWDIENSLANCAFFAKDFYQWCQSKGIDCKLVYCEQSAPDDVREDHIIPMVGNNLIDFVYTDKGVSKTVRENSIDALNRQMTPEITNLNEFKDKYSKWGYHTPTIISYDEAYGENGMCQTIELKETIKVPIEVGDTVLGGRFKNKKVVVKKIGKNKKGDITINDKPLLKFRIVKESLQEDVDYYLRHLEDDNFLIQVSDDYFRIFKPINGTVYSYSNCNPFQWSEIAGEIDRYVSELEGKSIDYCYVVKKEYGVVNRKQIHPQMLLDQNFDAGENLVFTIGFK